MLSIYHMFVLRPCARFADRCVDILELSELRDLLTFHRHTLRLYSALCSHGNTQLAHALCSHVDQSQFLYALQCRDMPGPLRQAYYALLSEVHLSAHASARQAMTHEYIVPMSKGSRAVTLYNSRRRRHSLPGSVRSASLWPRLHFATPCFIRPPDEGVSGGAGGGSLDGGGRVEDVQPDSPWFPVPQLKALLLGMLREAVCAAGRRVRDPAGGSVELLLVPLLRLLHTLLLMGVYQGPDLRQALRLILPGIYIQNWVITEDVDDDDDEDQDDEAFGMEFGRERGGTLGSLPKQGLLQMKLPEAVKLQVSLRGERICANV